MTDYDYMVLLREQWLNITGSDEPQESVPQMAFLCFNHLKLHSGLYIWLSTSSPKLKRINLEIPWHGNEELFMAMNSPQ